MRYVLVVICAFITLFPCTGRSQGAADSVYWSEGCQLRWDDFQGKAEDAPIVGARTYTSLKYKLLDYDTSCRVIVKCVFLKKMSWMKPQHATDYALKHEQIHFDISELYARKLRQAFCNYRYNKETVNEDVADIFMRICEEKTWYNQQYDKETCHSLDKEKQQVWRDMITAQLDELREYRSN